MKEYNPEIIERKWQKKWEQEKCFRAKDNSPDPKFYALVEFPYPSGSGLHVGHCRSYVGMDIVCRKKRMEGFNVLFPMGWDAFGLPTENYAVKTGIHPAKVTEKNTKTFKEQQKRLGLSFDWAREVNTSDPKYYKWTQWIFVQLFKKGLAYKRKIPINWCPSCKIGLANEEATGGKCERCGEQVVKKEKEQWLLKITKYADRLLKDLEKVDYPERVKVLQKEWIGKSQGTEIKFSVSDTFVNVFTTRPDTLFGCTYLVLAPEHPLIEKLKDKIENFKEVKDYAEKTKLKPEKERLAEDKEKTGVELKGLKAENPVNKKKIPIFVADYVLINYGTGAIMAVPAHDQRDLDFARKHSLPVVEVIKGGDPEKEAYEGAGPLVNSGKFDGLDSEKASLKISDWLSEKGLGKKSVCYKLRDWIFSRQRYWGEPIPMIYCKKCGWVSVPEKDLPVELPEVKEYRPTEEGESPLAKAKNWVSAKCPLCGGEARRETDVMPNWAGSNWYYLRYCDPSNNKKIADNNLLKYWMPIDWYNGGMEHTTLHLLYSRFIFKFLWEIGAIPKSIGPEPYAKRTSHGIILGEGGIKMSKSKGNVVNPEDVRKKYGTDTLRIYEMFMGPFEQMIPWDTKGLIGAKRFLRKAWKTGDSVKEESSLKVKKSLHKTIKKVSEDIESMKFNTAISSLMEFVNVCQEEEISKKDFQEFLKILSPFAPHITEELWQATGSKGLCCCQKWPKYDQKLTEEEQITLVIQISGKVRDKIEVKKDISQKEAEERAFSSKRIKKLTQGKKIKKVFFIPNKLINIVV